jgi:hypothetical protein
MGWCNQIPLLLTQPELVKKALNRPHQIYNRYKEAEERQTNKVAVEQEPPTIDAHADSNPGPLNPTEVASPPPELSDEPTSSTSVSTPEDERQSIALDSAAKTALHRAEQVYIAASTGSLLPAHLVVPSSNSGSGSTGKSAFLSIHFDTNGLDTLSNVGWAVCWYSAEGEELRDQGLWE